MIKIIRDICSNLKLVVEGEIKIDKTKITPYDEYVKKEEQKQVKEQIYNMLLNICPAPTSVYFYRESYQHKQVLRELALYLAKDIK